MPKHSRVFRRFLVSYIIILIIPSIAGYMSYQTSISVTQSLAIENSVTQIQKSQEILERRMAEVEGFTRQMAINQDLGILMNEVNSSDKTNVYGIWKMMKDVLTFGQTNDFLQHFFIYLTNYNVVLTPGSAYYRPEHYYDSFHYKDLSFDQWKKEVLESTHRSEIMPLSEFVNKGTETSVVTYMQSLPLDSFSKASPAIVVVIIDQKTITSLLSGLTERYGGWARIADAQDRTIGLQGIEEDEVKELVSDKRYDMGKVSQFYGDDLVITLTSNTNDWVYQAGIPRKVLLENANKIKSITFTVTGLALFVGLFVGFLLSYRNSAPMDRLVGIMKEQFGHENTSDRNEYDFLHGNISEMLNHNKRLESQLHEQQPLIRDAFLKRLIAGDFQLREELVAAAVQSHAGLNGSTGYVGIIQINGYSSGMESIEILNELSVARLLLKQSLMDTGSPIPMTDIWSDKIVFVFAFHEADMAKQLGREEIANTLKHISELAFQEYRISITVALGDFFASELEISQSFEQAKQTLEYALHTNKKELVWFDETRMDSATYYYPLDVETRLIRTVRAGEMEAAIRIFQSIIDQNTVHRELSVEMKHQWIGEMKGTFLKLLNQKAFQESELFEPVKNQIIDIEESSAIEQIQEQLNEVMVTLCSLITSKKNDGHAKLVDSIKVYIKESYADSELTLYRVAEQVGRPWKYISQIFKEVTGINLSEYLEKVRMENAEILLRESDLTMEEISEKVGYSSSHSFRRAFKRVTGVPPSSYRQSAEG
ncbi:helix-turn-helix domain-containing protein [Paenibacillus radicis (ex Gao et al. 2016)]|uniref:HTH araC/xylS-type domain-containing protein n=1 Tax=Paenibacillus radicis (ex Gao et al. 2016) TaxID=1737354 RepID=A0A917GQA8_9BACL|nr:AraC family transcriptional regulator [Paenibacillus radicis (ex Gao et al. 2016)]GGG54247.1 hypothetical protein GCM10010918_03830 [Paenibacillus radicis (ex Gao et al. 2016)]